MSSPTTLRVVTTDVGRGPCPSLILEKVCYVHSPVGPDLTPPVFSQAHQMHFFSALD
jgi:hypothetical protein